MNFQHDYSYETESVREIDSSFFNLLYPLVNESIARKKVLLIEKDLDTAVSIEAVFAEDDEIELQLARDSDEAMIHLIHNKFDLVVMEDHYHSPDLNKEGYIGKSNHPEDIIQDIRAYFAMH